MQERILQNFISKGKNYGLLALISKLTRAYVYLQYISEEEEHFSLVSLSVFSYSGVFASVDSAVFVSVD